jgi:rhamnosyltransferase
MNLIAVVITYYPDISELEKNILEYIANIDRLIIWENTPSVDKMNYRINLLQFEKKIVYLGTGKNEGIAFALNNSFKWAIQNSYTHILTMDQDSLWNNFALFIDKITELQSNKEYSIFAPKIIEFYSRNVLRCNNTDFVITSGAIYDLSAFQKIGCFRESFFIDEVDNEYCFRSTKYGFKIAVIEDCFLFQKFGIKDGSSIFKRYTANYSPMRTYYQTRNRMWVWREYSGMLSYRYLFRTLLLTVLRRSVLIIICETSKRDKLKALWRGFFVGTFFKPIT